MEKREEGQDDKGKDAQNGVKSLSYAGRTVGLEPCGMLCAIMRPLRDSGMLPGTDRYVELERMNIAVKRTLRDT